MSSINLLPPDVKLGLEQKRKNLVVLKILYRAIWVFIFVAVVVAGTWYYLENSARNVDEELSRGNESLAAFGNLETQAKKVSEKITAIKKIESGLNHWPGVVSEIQKVMPSGTYLSRMSLDSKQKARATMAGYATDKQSIAALRDALESSEYFEFVDIESASTESNPKTGVDIETFTLSFSIEKGALDE
jgi:Tfp pilus assembly protein PilN